MIQDLLITLFTDLVVVPVRAEIDAKLSAEHAPPEVIAQVTACITEAPKALATRAMAEPAWAVSAGFRVVTEALTPQALVRGAVPGCETALKAAEPYLAQLKI
ncbi:MAG: hypothetical protein SFV19_11845 [Rhodospirillaceae bacterium]|nr:hypothetical protein [Rhodospirillaceae bacterium]